MNVCVVGIGYVGLVTAGCLAEAGHKVICVDSDEAKIGILKQGQIPIYEYGLAEIVKRNEKAGRLEFTTEVKYGVDNSSIIFLAVGTPSAPDGSADISAIISATEQIANIISEYRIIVTKSTVPVGTHKKIINAIKSKTDVEFDYVSNPEFLKEGSAVEDFMRPDRIIIGTDKPAVRETMRQLYSPFFRKSDRVIFMDTTSAEMAKYAANTMLATRISFMNEISMLCEKLGADVESVRIGLGTDRRIGPAFLFAGVGFGGSCFPKDVRALIHTGKQCGVDMSIAQAVKQVNTKQQQRFAERILDYFAGKEQQTVLAVWGLAFKAKTDDVRESPAIYCISRFLEAGMKIRAYDPEAMPAASAALGNRIETCTQSYDTLDGSDALIIFTDWQEFRNPDFSAIAQKLNKPVIFDGRNLCDPALAAKAGIEYYSVGR